MVLVTDEGNYDARLRPTALIRRCIELQWLDLIVVSLGRLWCHFDRGVISRVKLHDISQAPVRLVRPAAEDYDFIRADLGHSRLKTW